MSNIEIYDAPGGPSGSMLCTYYFLPEGGAKYKFCNPTGGVIKTGLQNNGSVSWSVGSLTWTLSKLTFTAATPTTKEKAKGNWKLTSPLRTRDSGVDPMAEEEGTFVAQAGGRGKTGRPVPPAKEEVASSASA